MKEHMRDLFPERFEDSDNYKLADKIKSIVTNDTTRKKLDCERKVLEVFSRSNELTLLTGAMRKYGCNFKIPRHVVCESCNNCSGGFDPDTNQIIICHNTGFLTKDKIHATLMHEMIHMFDYCRAKMDFTNLDHIACSEIRAANLTYCSLIDRLSFGPPEIFGFKKSHRYCVQDVAFRSVKAYSPDTSDEIIWNVVDKVFPACYNDLEPFGRRPTSGIKDLKQSFRERYYYGYV